ncbi:winged helix-turn-helix transcriptional regulator [Streptomyces iconiensis]|uniref:Helix-turn-helix domain-containing protein n=1 Tax=Streptomyces iconiensis TaxID=1384038 RepID=A0ABT7AB26_9ACTN|nr:helix-turn-helix domain-containing protein [Streptomyces iconiensis]MDJ1138011.1 helix-turn-helix domain-containing protein [Streptomyces iconiensis]
MPSRSRRSYDQFCAIARALDSVGDRWTLLIVRELLAGPRRYTDLHADLPGVSTDVLASRLKHMEGEGLAERRRQARPGAGHVYELTARGRELLPVLSALSDFGAPALGKPRPTDAVRAHWWAVPLRTALEAALADMVGSPPGEPGGVVDVRLPEGAFHVRLGEQGPPWGEGAAPQRADAGLELDSEACARLAEGSATLADAIRAGSVRVTGEGPVAEALRPAG